MYEPLRGPIVLDELGTRERTKALAKLVHIEIERILALQADMAKTEKEERRAKRAQEALLSESIGEARSTRD